MSGPVDDAVNTIQNNLSEGLTDWDVSHGDLIENNRVLADLSPQQRNEAIAKLSDGDLDKWESMSPMPPMPAPAAFSSFFGRSRSPVTPPAGGA